MTSKIIELRYVGPHDEVVIAATGATVERFGVVEIVERLAAGLLDQPTNWQLANPANAPATDSSNDENDTTDPSAEKE